MIVRFRKARQGQLLLTAGVLLMVAAAAFVRRVVGAADSYPNFERVAFAFLVVALVVWVRPAALLQKKGLVPALLCAAALTAGRLRENTTKLGLPLTALPGLLLAVGQFALFFVLAKALYALFAAQKPRTAPEQGALTHRQASLVFFVLAFGGLCFFWLFNYYPSMTSMDTISQWGQIHGTRPYSDLHALGHTLYMQLLLRLWNSYGIVVLVNLLMVSFVYGLLGGYLYRHGAPFSFLAVLIGFFLCFRRIQVYMYPWKDTPYTFMLAIAVYFVMRSLEPEYTFPLWHALVLGLALGLMVAFRYNGLIPLLFCLVYFGIWLVRRRMGLRLACLVLLSVLPVAGFNLYGYKVLGAISPPNGFSIQFFGSGVAAVVAKGGNITPEQQARIDAYLPVEFIYEWYHAWDTYMLIWHNEEPLPEMDPDLNNSFIVATGENKLETIRLYIELGLQNPRIMLANLAFGTYEVWGVFEVYSHSVLAAALFLAVCAKWNRKKLRQRWVVFAPVAANTLSIIISTVTNEPRYLLPTFMLFVPLLAYVLFMPDGLTQTEKEKPYKIEKNAAPVAGKAANNETNPKAEGADFHSAKASRSLVLPVRKMSVSRPI